MAGRRRMMSESEESWDSGYQNAHGGSEDDILTGREDIFDNTKTDTSNPVLRHNEENVLENPVEGPVQWKMVDGYPIQVRTQAPAPANPDLRNTLVAVEGPTGVLVAKAIRNTRTGKVQHTEAMRLPTQHELQEIKTKAQIVPAPKGALGAVDPAAAVAAATAAAPSSIPWTKVAIGGAAVAAAWLAWRHFNKDD